jgi:hypothetical protein
MPTLISFKVQGEATLLQQKVNEFLNAKFEQYQDQVEATLSIADICDYINKDMQYLWLMPTTAVTTEDIVSYVDNWGTANSITISWI